MAEESSVTDAARLQDDVTPFFTVSTAIHMADTDAAQVLYFAQQFDIAHRVYEAMMESRGSPLGPMLRAGAMGLPIVHAEGDYRRPLRLSDAIEVGVGVAALSERSFTLQYRITHGESVAAIVRTKHVCIDATTGRPMALPDALRVPLAEALR
jgi:1,4-dihydroxy-2-naphthoyl-CoA hydrolase